MKKIIYILIVIFFVACNKKQKDSIVKHAGPQEQIVQEKYAKILNVPATQITNIKLYTFLDKWIGTKYKYGGMSESGVDCSGFCNILYNQVYNKELPRTTKEISKKINKVGKDELQEGSLVFFNIAQKKNSHVGIYLKSNKFVHASTSKGVIISSLDNPYYHKAYSKGGGYK